MMVSLPSGSHKSIKLLEIETNELKLIIKGKYNSTKFVSLSDDIQMSFSISDQKASVHLYNPVSNQLEDYHTINFPQPIFFENGQYQVYVRPKNEERYTFYHEYQPFREAITVVDEEENRLLGTLHFMNEIGLSTFEIRQQDSTILSFTVEVFPAKLDYQKDYKALLHEINNEIYNLTYSFIQRTHLKASAKIYKDPSPTEFYRLIMKHFDEYIHAIQQIERMPHHQFETTYTLAKGEKLGRQDSTGRTYLRKNVNRFIDVENGLQILGKSVMPTRGLLIKKQHTIDTQENRYIKWTMTRLKTKIALLMNQYIYWCKGQQREPDIELVSILTKMENSLLLHLKQSIWRQVGKLDRSVHSLVLQMATGYKEVFQVYAYLFQSLILYGDSYKMSLKNIATLYEYWTFLKLGQILREKCQLIDQDVVKYNDGGIYVRLRQDQTSTFKFLHPITEEEIILQYQFKTNKSPTVTQEPDSMLSIGKRGKDYHFQYIFDAKYKVEVINEDMVGPKNEDINTMHRYRDSIVIEKNGKYERTAFGAYVLFPWKDDEQYKQHKFYKSIEKVNIGGLPFLPNNSKLVEQIIANLLIKNADELQRDGILPQGTVQYLNEENDTLALLVPVSYERLKEITVSPFIGISLSKLPTNWRDVKTIALVDVEAVKELGEITSYEVRGNFIVFHVTSWNTISPNKQNLSYTLSENIIVNKNSLSQARTLAEIFIKPGVERELWYMFLRVSNESFVELNEKKLTQRSYVKNFYLDNLLFELIDNKMIHKDIEIDLSEISHAPSKVFNQLYKLLTDYPKSE